MTKTAINNPDEPAMLKLVHDGIDLVFGAGIFRLLICHQPITTADSRRLAQTVFRCPRLMHPMTRNREHAIRTRIRQSPMGERGHRDDYTHRQAGGNRPHGQRQRLQGPGPIGDAFPATAAAGC